MRRLLRESEPFQVFYKSSPRFADCSASRWSTLEGASDRASSVSPGTRQEEFVADTANARPRGLRARRATGVPRSVDGDDTARRTTLTHERVLAMGQSSHEPAGRAPLLVPGSGGGLGRATGLRRAAEFARVLL